MFKLLLKAKKVWDRKSIKLKTKLKVYSAVVLPSLLYGCETWTVYSPHAKKLNHFHLSCLRIIMKVKWQDKIPDSEILTKAKSTSIHTMLSKAQLRWSGHLVRMPDERLPKQIFYGELKHGKRSHGGQRKRYKDCLKSSLKNLNINPNDWEKAACDRSEWRSLIHQGAIKYENQRISTAEEKRRQRKAHNTQQEAERTLPCPYCDKLFLAQIGLTSHLRTHRRQRGPLHPWRTNNNNKSFRANVLQDRDFSPSRIEKLLHISILSDKKDHHSYTVSAIAIKHGRNYIPYLPITKSSCANFHTDREFVSFAKFAKHGKTYFFQLNDYKN